MGVKFDPNGAATVDSGIFGLPYKKEESQVILNSIPWEATASYGEGCSFAPAAIIEASKYVELFVPDLGKFYEKGIYANSQNEKISYLNKKARKAAKPIIENGGYIKNNKKLIASSEEVNRLSVELNTLVKNETNNVIGNGKICGTIGGDHSISLGSIAAHVQKYPNVSVLQIDAHCDLRTEFESFKYSHASVMWNVLNETNLSRLVQVGIRAFCEDEFKFIQSSNSRVAVFTEQNLQNKLAKNQSWSSICEEIVNNLTETVYVSCDIDGLESSLCPNTGTPVPGGIRYSELLHLLRKITESDKKIIGFDLVEVSPESTSNFVEDWNAIVGAHLLYQLCGLALILD